MHSLRACAEVQSPAMNLLALDTCDSRGSVSVLRDGQVLQTVEHDTADDYSDLAAARDRLRTASEWALTFADIDVYVAASAPAPSRVFASG